MVAPSGLTTTAPATIAPKSTSNHSTTKRDDGAGDDENTTETGDQDEANDKQSLLLGTNKLNSNQINSVQRSASLKDHRAFR